MSASERPASLAPLARLGFSRLTDAEGLLQLAQQRIGLTELAEAEPRESGEGRGPFGR